MRVGVCGSRRAGESGSGARLVVGGRRRRFPMMMVAVDVRDGDGGFGVPGGSRVTDRNEIEAEMESGMRREEKR